MTKNVRQTLSIVLCMCLLLSGFVTTGFAKEQEGAAGFGAFAALSALPDPIIDFSFNTLVDGNKVINMADGAAYEVLGASPTLVESMTGYGNALKFSRNTAGNENYINLGTGYQVQRDFTIAAWIKLDEFSDLARIVGRSQTGNPSPQNELTLRVRRGSMRLESESVGISASVDNAVKIGEWAHVAVTYNGSSEVLYVNGAPAALASGQYVPSNVNKINTTVPLLVGSGWNSAGTAPFRDHSFAGLMDDLKIYDVALTAQQIEELAWVSAEDQLPPALIHFDFSTLIDSKVVNKANGLEYTVSGAAASLESNMDGRGNALRFNGTNNYIDLGTSYNTQITTRYTIAAWIKLDTGFTDVARIVGRNGSNASDFTLFVHRDSMSLRSESMGYHNSANNAVVRGEWQHVAVTYNGGNLESLYVNGVDISTGAPWIDGGRNKNVAGASSLLVGGSWNTGGTALQTTHFFQGLMADLRVYNVGMTPDQIEILAGLGGEAKISITTQPAASTAVMEGAVTGSLTIAASVTPSGTPAYQWFSNTLNSNEGGAPIPGATGASFTIPANLALGSYYYFCEVSAPGIEPVRSNVAVVSVYLPSLDPVYFFDMDEVFDGTGDLLGQKVVRNRVDGKEYPIFGQYSIDNRGIHDNAIVFNGQNTYINIGKVGEKGVRSNYTMMAWINNISNANDLNKIFASDRTGVTSDAFYLALRGNGSNAGRIETYITGPAGGSGGWAGSINTTIRYQFDTWSHIAITSREDDGIRIYLNGEQIGQSLLTGSNRLVDLSTSPRDMFIGVGYNNAGNGIFSSHAFDGRMDEVKIYNVALTQEQIQGAMAGIVIPPEVMTVNPPTSALLTENDREFSVTFSVPVTISTNFNYIKFIEVNNETNFVDCDLEWASAGVVLRITLKGSLQAGKTYALTIPEDAVTDAAGVPNIVNRLVYNTKESLEGDAAGSPLDYWALKPVKIPSNIAVAGDILTMSNGLVERKFDISKNFKTIGYKNLYTGLELLDQNNLQADIILTLNDRYSDGNNRGADRVTPGPDGLILDFPIGGETSVFPTFIYDSHWIEDSTEEMYHWEYMDIWSDPTMKDTPWPALGKAVVVKYVADAGVHNLYKDVEVLARYEIYDGVPVISKTISVTNKGAADVVVHRLKTEILPIPKNKRDAMYIDSNFNAGNQNHDRNNGKINVTTYEDRDTYGAFVSRYAISDQGAIPPEWGPAYRLKQNETFNGFKVYQMFHSTDYYEWQQMEMQKMYRVLFPQVTDNPTIYHYVGSDSAGIRNAIDQAAAAGFNMVLMSFGSGVNTADVSQANLTKFKDLADYGKTKNVVLGSYIMLTAWLSQPDYETFNGVWGSMRCQTSKTATDTLSNTLRFMEYTGFVALEIDGAYPNTRCNNRLELHIGHEGEQDSIVKQWENATRDFYIGLRATNVYILAPDWHFLAGASKACMGYRENGFGYPRERQLIYGREIGYYGTFGKTPSMGWAIIPFDSVYTAPGVSGQDAAFYPYETHIREFDSITAVNMLQGVSGSYRGSRGLYTPGGASEKVMSYWGNLFNDYRSIINADVVHIAPPVYAIDDVPNKVFQTTDIDGIIHVTSSPDSPQKALLALFNQTGGTVTKQVKVPLYFTGLTDLKLPPPPVPESHYRMGMMLEAGCGDWFPPPVPIINKPAGAPTGKKAAVYWGDMIGQEYTIDSNGDIEIEVTIPNNAYVWYTVYAPEDAPNITVAIPAPEAYVVSSSSSQVRLAWNAITINGAEVKDYYVYRNGQFLGKAFTNAYTDSAVVSNVTYTYTISAVYNTIEGPASAPLTVVTQADLTPPVIERARALTGTIVEVRFNKPVESASALAAANYNLTGGTVGGASFGSDARTVLLTITPKMIPFVEITLTVNNVRDTSANNNTIAPDSSVEFVYGYLRHFGFEEADGNTAVDSVAGANGTIGGAPVSRVKGKSGTALELNGTSNYVNVGSVINALDEYAIDGWFKPELISGTQTLVGMQRENSSYSGWWIWRLQLIDGALVFTANNGLEENDIRVELSSGAAVATAGKWNHFALIRDGDTFKLYLNGVKVAEQTQAGLDHSQNPSAIWLGAYESMAGAVPTVLFKGVMDEVNIYNTALTDGCVEQLYKGSCTFNAWAKDGEFFASLTNGTLADVEGRFLLAVYNSKGALVKMESVQFLVEPGDVLENVFTSITADDVLAGYTVKAFCWDANYVPLTGAITI